VSYVRDNPNEENILKTLRELFITNGDRNILPDEIRQKSFETPYEVRYQAVRDFLDALKVQKKLVREGKKKKFEMHFRRGKDPSSILIRKKDIKVQGNGSIQIYPTLWGKEDILTKGKFPNFLHDTRILYVPRGYGRKRFYLCVPIDKDVLDAPQEEVVALDPGVKIFHTTFDTNNETYLFGSEDGYKLEGLKRVAERIRSGIKRTSRPNDRGNRTFERVPITKGMKKASDSIERKIKNCISEMHRKTVNFLCSKYSTIILPRFATKGMVKRLNRKIGKKATKTMILLSHYKFRMLLQAKAEEKGVKVILGSEYKSSMTCTNCFWENRSLGRSREYSCKSCGVRYHRDVGAARNILMINWYLVDERNQENLNVLDQPLHRVCSSTQG
jgi:transposase